MIQKFIPSGFACCSILCLALIAHAANKPKSPPATVDIVQELLQTEPSATNETADRRVALKPSDRPETNSNAVWWQSGFVQSRKQWKSFEESLATETDATLLNEYREQRAQWNQKPHGQWKLANWCRKNELYDQERVHLIQALIERDPTVKIDSVFERLNFQKVGNNWISPEEQREAAKAASEIEQSHKRWDTRLAALGKQLESNPKQRAVAEQKLAEVTDPLAVPAIVDSYCLASESFAEYGVKTLGQIPEFQASRALAGQAVFSPWRSVRKSAIQLLKHRKLEEFVPDLLLLLSVPTRSAVVMSASPRGFMSSLNWEYVSVEETQDTIRIGIRRLFPYSLPPGAVQLVSKNHPEKNGLYDWNTGNRLTWTDINTVLFELSEQRELLDHNADRLNDLRLSINERVGQILSDCVNEPVSSEPAVWWNWWTNYSNLATSSQKNVVIVDERKFQPDAPSITKMYITSCLVAGTPVWTERGFTSIESIQPGDRVLSKDVISGELSYKPVLRTTVRQPTPVRKFYAGDNAVEASLGHHFWVSGQGWRKTRELCSENPLHTVTGIQRISKIDDEGRVERVYNLVVADFHTYFVGKSMLLSHDVTTPQLTNVKVPGLTPK